MTQLGLVPPLEIANGEHVPISNSPRLIHFLHNFNRCLQAAYMIVDEMHEEHPELLRDQYWECVVPKDLPYTVASEHYRRDEPKGSAEKYKVKKEDAMYANIMPGGGKRMLNDDVYADYVSNTEKIPKHQDILTYIGYLNHAN